MTEGQACALTLSGPHPCYLHTGWTLKFRQAERHSEGTSPCETESLLGTLSEPCSAIYAQSATGYQLLIKQAAREKPFIFLRSGS